MSASMSAIAAAEANRVAGNLKIAVRIGACELHAEGGADDVRVIYEKFLENGTTVGAATAGAVETDDQARLSEALGMRDPRPMNGAPLRDWGAEDATDDAQA